MWTYPEEFDVIVVGAGHAGCEAAHAAAKMGARTLLLTMTLDTIAKMSCNPAVGGTAKGHIVREIDALGGLMGKNSDQTGIQFRMLNASKGPAVWSPRAQADKFAYANAMKHRLERTPSLFIQQGTIESLIVEGEKITGVETLEGIAYRAKAVIVSSGTFMRGLIHIGQTQFAGGRSGINPLSGYPNTSNHSDFNSADSKREPPLGSTGAVSIFHRWKNSTAMRESAFPTMNQKAPDFHKCPVTSPIPMKRPKKLSKKAYTSLRCTQDRSKA